ncbi:histidine phosphatase family protein [Nodosilinea sp. LEGE 07088]|uniref:histidine phosphatase family protein n=1 Tax=Nodosilinea sp. LEGE 07088 TaxID=2777968 RepID=UPI0018818D1A|nr:histidine phosphatase family protein [Nodosilinea sp. LEGE 07088]MBE9138714.1 histidine phosphatase family protein [Nodosilinea sp. LEGE 07088]
MTVLKLLLVRHGQSVGNTEGRMEGVSSTGLTPLGVQQSQRLGQHLATMGWHPTHLYCSPLKRATATLAILTEGLGQLSSANSTQPQPSPPSPAPLAADHTLPVTVLDDLKEYDCGIFTGLTWAEACDRYPDLCHQLETSLDWQPIPQAETLAQGQGRARRVVDTLLSHGNGDRVMVVSHQWILQQVIAQLMGCDRTWGLPIGNTGCFEFWLDRDRWPQPGPNRLNTELWQIKRFNDTSHCRLPG